jgi:hypothetical protein
MNKNSKHHSGGTQYQIPNKLQFPISKGEKLRAIMFEFLNFGIWDLSFGIYLILCVLCALCGKNYFFARYSEMAWSYFAVRA